MSKRIAAKYKIDRRLGVNLWGRPKSPFNSLALWPWPAWPGAQEKAHRFWHSVDGQAKAKGLLWLNF